MRPEYVLVSWVICKLREKSARRPRTPIVRINKGEELLALWQACYGDRVRM